MIFYVIKLFVAGISEFFHFSLGTKVADDEFGCDIYRFQSHRQRARKDGYFKHNLFKVPDRYYPPFPTCHFPTFNLISPTFDPNSNFEWLQLLVIIKNRSFSGSSCDSVISKFSFKKFQKSFRIFFSITRMLNLIGPMTFTY